MILGHVRGEENCGSYIPPTSSLRDTLRDGLEGGYLSFCSGGIDLHSFFSAHCSFRTRCEFPKFV